MIERVALPGSERRVHPGSSQIGYPNPGDLMSVTIMLKRRDREAHPPLHERISHAQFADQFGADPADIQKIQAFATTFNLTVVETSIARRSVVLTGTVANMNEAFGTQLHLYQGPEGIFRGRTGMLYIPAEIEPVVVGVFGLDERPQAKTRFCRLRTIRPRAAGDTSYTPDAIAKLYNFPTKGIGKGQTVAIVELGGGFTNSDLTTYFGNLKISPVPNVTSVSVDGGVNQPSGDPSSADGEVLLDIEVVGAVAPGANIVVYFAPNTDQGFLDAITTAVHDQLRKPSVISISWGGPESSWTAQSLTAYDQAFQDAAALGVTVCVASGDDGSNDGVGDGAAHVDFPSASPHVLACGGTRLESSGGVIQNEVTWNEGPGNGSTGGGVSETFPLPAYQNSAKVPVSVNPGGFKGRGVPDVAGDADPATGYQVYVDGQQSIIGGTSAVAPLWAGLIALINEQLGKPVGYVNPALYAKAGSGKLFHDIISGNNGAYSAGPGWDACTGLGSPDGQAILTALSAPVAAT